MNESVFRLELATPEVCLAILGFRPLPFIGRFPTLGLPPPWATY